VQDISSRDPRRQESAFRHPRALDGGHRQRSFSLSKVRAFGATFFIFSDYARPAIRLSALMELPTIVVFTHDAMATARTARPTSRGAAGIAARHPGLVTLRPGDANEVVEAYRYVMQLRHQPAVLVLSRQPLPTLDRRTLRPRHGRCARCVRARGSPGRESRGDTHRLGGER